MGEEEKQQEGSARQHLEEKEQREAKQGWHSRVRSQLGDPATGVTPTHEPIMEGDTFIVSDLHFSYHSARALPLTELYTSFIFLLIFIY